MKKYFLLLSFIGLQAQPELTTEKMDVLHKVIDQCKTRGADLTIGQKLQNFPINLPTAFISFIATSCAHYFGSGGKMDPKWLAAHAAGAGAAGLVVQKMTTTLIKPEEIAQDALQNNENIARVLHIITTTANGYEASLHLDHMFTQHRSPRTDAVHALTEAKKAIESVIKGMSSIRKYQSPKYTELQSELFTTIGRIEETQKVIVRTDAWLFEQVPHTQTFNLVRTHAISTVLVEKLTILFAAKDYPYVRMVEALSEINNKLYTLNETYYTSYDDKVIYERNIVWASTIRDVVNNIKNSKEYIQQQAIKQQREEIERLKYEMERLKREQFHNDVHNMNLQWQNWRLEDRVNALERDKKRNK